MNIVLASNSPRRREILSQLNIKFEVVPSSFEETLINMEPPELVEHFAYMKALDVFEKIQGCYFNVVGLPVNKLFKIMKKFGINLI